MIQSISYLEPSVALSLLDIQELFGRGYELNYSYKDGFAVSEELIGLKLNNRNYTLPVVKTDLLHSKIFIHDHGFPSLTGSVYGFNKTVQVQFSGPNGKTDREVSVFNIDTAYWVKKGDMADYFLSIQIETLNSSHIFRGIPVIESFTEKNQLVLNSEWKKIFKGNQNISILNTNLTENEKDLILKPLLTENDIRLAIMKKQKIDLKKVVKITPSALEMGKSAKIFY